MQAPLAKHWLMKGMEDTGTEGELLSSCLRLFFRKDFDNCESPCLLFSIDTAFLIGSIFKEFNAMALQMLMP